MPYPGSTRNDDSNNVMWDDAKATQGRFDDASIAKWFSCFIFVCLPSFQKTRTAPDRFIDITVDLRGLIRGYPISSMGFLIHIRAKGIITLPCSLCLFCVSWKKVFFFLNPSCLDHFIGNTLLYFNLSSLHLQVTSIAHHLVLIFVLFGDQRNESINPHSSKTRRAYRILNTITAAPNAYAPSIGMKKAQPRTTRLACEITWTYVPSHLPVPPGRVPRQSYVTSLRLIHRRKRSTTTLTTTR